MGRVVFLFLMLTITSCSSRVVYEASTATAVSRDAVNINIASVDELEKLPHIGRKTADSIVSFRHENGPFRRPEYLLQIRGVSESRFAEIRQYIRTE